MAVAAPGARVGCSGFSYKDWRGIVYPADMPQSCWLQHYATMFDTVELNNTFYRLPTAHAVEQWAHPCRTTSCSRSSSALRNAPQEVARCHRHGCRSTSTAPSASAPTRTDPCAAATEWRRNAARLDEFLALVPATMRWAVELRDSSWLHDESSRCFGDTTLRCAFTTCSPTILSS